VCVLITVNGILVNPEKYIVFVQKKVYCKKENSEGEGGSA